VSDTNSSDDNASDGLAAEQLLPLVYNELRKLAAVRLAQEKRSQTLQATDLVHEVYVRLASRPSNTDATGGVPHWNGRKHFFGAAAEAMRRILIERARRKDSQKHGGGKNRVDCEELEIAPVFDSVDLMEIDQAVEKLQQLDPRAAEIVKLRYYVGLNIPEIAAALEVSRSTIDRQWAWARAWLHVELGSFLKDDP